MSAEEPKSPQETVSVENSKPSKQSKLSKNIVESETKKADQQKKINNVESIYLNYNENLKSVSYYFQKFGAIASVEDVNLSGVAKNAILDALNSLDFDHTLTDPEEIAQDVRLKFSDSLFRKKLREARNLESNVSANNFDLLSKGSFLMLNNYFEYLLADLLTYFYNTFQNSLGDKDFKMSLKEINDFESISDLIKSLVEKEVEAILIEKTFEKLLEHFEDYLKVSLSREIIDWDRITEYRERRHIIVHNSSVVNKKYITRSKNPFNLKIGDIVEISNEYFIKAHNDFKLAGFLIIFDCWGNWDKKNINSAISKLNALSFEYLEKDLNELCLNVCQYCEKIESKNEHQEDILLKSKINKCIALKRLNQKTALAKELKSIKVGTATPIYKIAHQILNDNDNYLYDNFKRAKNLGEINLDEYEHWPLFEFLRSRADIDKEIKRILSE